LARDVDEASLPSKCRSELNAIKARNETEAAIEPLKITDDCELHLFVKREHWPDTESKPLAAAFGKVEMSVEATGGPFGAVSKQDLKRAMMVVKEATGQDLIGAVSIQAGKIYDDEALKFVITHDPNPFEDPQTGKVMPQSPRHAQIVCDKQSTKRRERLREICEPSLSPSEVNSIDINPEPIPSAVASQ
jgi:hypothetical protein